MAESNAPLGPVLDRFHADSLDDLSSRLDDALADAASHLARQGLSDAARRVDQLRTTIGTTGDGIGESIDRARIELSTP
jgi:hypothetical protein